MYNYEKGYNTDNGIRDSHILSARNIAVSYCMYTQFKKDLFESVKSYTNFAYLFKSVSV